MAKKNSQPLVLCISDIHCGSTVGLMPSVFETSEGQVVRANKFQQWLKDSWDQCVQDFHKYRGNRDYILLLVGDMIEGHHHGGKQLWSGESIDHANAAIELLEPVSSKASKVFLAVGTECHTRNDEHYIGTMLGAEACPATGKHAWDSVLLKVNGHLIHARHHMPTASRVYLEAGALSIMLGNTQLSCVRNKQEVPDIVVSGHRHRFGVYYDEDAMFVACGAWQGLTRHGHKVVPGALPRPGFVVMDWSRGSELPYTFAIRQPQPKAMEPIAVA
jgi:UDP-2,3-diacylglucosamine pyrophosphatase LpxH